MARLSVEVSDELHRAAKVKAAAGMVTLTEVVRAYLEDWTHGKAETPAGARPQYPPVAKAERPFKPIAKADQAKGKTRKR